MTYTRHLFNSDGYWVAFLVGRDLFWRDGERLGWVEPPSPPKASPQTSPQTSDDDRSEQAWRGGVVTAENGDPIGIITAHNVLQLQEAAVARFTHS
jgi:hypothetical protein